MIKVNTVALEENASNLQKIEMQVADILYDISLVEKELTCNHTVFEEEIKAIQRQTTKLEEENSRYGEEVPVTDTTRKSGSPEVKVAGHIDLTMMKVYHQNQPNRMNRIRRHWINRWIFITPWGRSYWRLMKAPVVKRSQVLLFASDTELNRRIKHMIHLMVK